MLVSGPVALALQQQSRAAWFLFAVVAALVTVWVVRVLPPRTPAPPHDRETDGDPSLRWWPTGAVSLVGASFVLGLASVAVWTFGQELVADSTDIAWLAPLVWTVMGAAGIAGAFAGPVLSRLGIAIAWTVLMVLLALGSAGLAVGAGVPAVALGAGSVFGASYIALTGVLLVWAPGSTAGAHPPELACPSSPSRLGRPSGPRCSASAALSPRCRWCSTWRRCWRRPAPFSARPPRRMPPGSADPSRCGD